MKRLNGRSEKEARSWAEYDENDYDWDSAEENSGDRYLEEEEEFYGEADEIEEDGDWTEDTYSTKDAAEEDAYYTEDTEEENTYFTKDAAEEDAYYSEDAEEENVYSTEDAEEEDEYYPEDAEEENAYSTEDAEEEDAYYTEGTEEEDAYFTKDAAEEDAYYTEDTEEEDEYFTKDAAEEGAYYTEGTEEEDAYYTEDTEEEDAYFTKDAAEEGVYYPEEIEEGDTYFTKDAVEENVYYAEGATEEDAYYPEDAAEEDAYYYEEDYGTAREAGAAFGEEDYDLADGYGPDGSAEVYETGEALYEEEFSDEYGMEEPYCEEEDSPYLGHPVRRKKSRGKKQSKQGGLAKIGKAFGKMDAMDKIMAFTGAAVVVLAVVTACVFIGSRTIDRQVDDLKNVGKQLDGITMIGEKGLLAVADAQREKLEASTVIDQNPEEPTPTPTPTRKPDYQESGYERQVSVLPSFTSIQKDLKIKFINRKTDKLVPNVPFSVTVTDPDGKTVIWSDDDMDGIIYKKDIAPGTYKVAMESLTDAKYAGYTLSLDSQSVEVKKEIVYKKVDVANEVKQESEVNTKQEDTKKNEVVVESSLQDTVAWVESKVIATSYQQVEKSTIQDPLTLALGRRFLQVTGNVSGTPPDEPDVVQPSTETPPDAAQPSTETPPDAAQPSTETPPDAVQPSTETPATPPPAETDTPTTPPPAETDTPTTPPPADTDAPTTPPPAETETPTTPPPAETQTPTPTPTPGPLSVTVNQNALVGSVGGTMAAIAAVTGFPQGSTVEFIISSDNAAVATATINQTTGDITIQGKAVGTANLIVTANYKDGKPETAGTAVIVVTIKDSMDIRLDKNAMTIYAQNPVDITATVINALQPVQVVATTSDVGKAVVSAKDNVVTVVGVAEGTAVITITYTEGMETVSAACAVTIKKNPKEDTATLLKDIRGQQIYVLENNEYREATSADYYTASAFYVKADATYTGWQTIDGKVYYYTADGKKVTGEQIIQGAKYNFASDGSMVVGNGTVGIDVSKWNGKIDWNGVKNSGVSYVIIRSGYRGSTEGTLIVDPAFAENIQGANAAGLKVGVYFYSQAIDEIEAVEEASMVLDQIRNYKISYPVFLDVESSGGRGDTIDSQTRTAVCKAFCQTIQNAGYTAGIYSNKNWLEAKIDVSALNAYKIWMAQYAATPTYAGRYDLWQYRANGSINGIEGNVDMNISYLGY